MQRKPWERETALEAKARRMENHARKREVRLTLLESCRHDLPTLPYVPGIIMTKHSKYAMAPAS